MAQVDRSDGGAATPTRPDRGWSLDFSASRRIGTTLGAVALTIAAAIAPATTLAGYDPASDVNSMFNTTAYTGATAWWAAGYTGQGVDVAVIDTGVSQVDGLDGSGKVVYGPDLSLRIAGPEPDQPRHERPRHVHGRADRGQEPRLPRHGSRRADRVGQGRRRGRWHRCQPGHRGDRLGRPASQRRRSQHPDHQPVVRHQLGAGLPRRPAGLRRRAGLESRASSSSPRAATTASRTT